MYFTFDNEFDFMKAYRLTPNELFFLTTLLVLQDDDEPEYFKKYLELLHSQYIDVREILTNLQDKGIFLQSYKIPKKDETFDPFDIPINKNFLKSMYKSSFEMGQELFDTYPQFGIINSSAVPLRTVAKHFNSLEDAFFKYGKAIKWNPSKHSKIIDLVKWGKDNNIISMSLSSFIINHSWEDLESMHTGDKTNINYDSMRLL